MNQSLFEYILRLGDNSLILGHRLSEWCGHGPELEEDIALTNISLDLIGQATNFLEYASVLDENGRTADDLAYLRDISDFRCAALLQQPNGDFAQTIVRQYCFDQYQYILLEALVESKDEHLAAIAAKSIKEVSYHLRHSSEWVLRLGQGTEESHKRMQDAIHKLWKFTGDLFEQLESDEVLIAEGITPRHDGHPICMGSKGLSTHAGRKFTNPGHSLLF